MAKASAKRRDPLAEVPLNPGGAIWAVIDRLRWLQDGDLPCKENQYAVDHLLTAAAEFPQPTPLTVPWDDGVSPEAVLRAAVPAWREVRNVRLRVAHDHVVAALKWLDHRRRLRAEQDVAGSPKPHVLSRMPK